MRDQRCGPLQFVFGGIGRKYQASTYPFAHIVQSADTTRQHHTLLVPQQLQTMSDGIALRAVHNHNVRKTFPDAAQCLTVCFRRFRKNTGGKPLVQRVKKLPTQIPTLLEKSFGAGGYFGIDSIFAGLRKYQRLTQRSRCTQRHRRPKPGQMLQGPLPLSFPGADGTMNVLTQTIGQVAMDQFYQPQQIYFLTPVALCQLYAPSLIGIHNW